VVVAFGIVVAMACVRWRYRIRIAGDAFAVLGRGDRLRYLAPVTELSMRMRYGNLVVGTDRRIEFYGVAHPYDVALVESVKRELDASRRGR
jgi:hypothetical protein